MSEINQIIDYRVPVHDHVKHLPITGGRKRYLKETFFGELDPDSNRPLDLVPHHDARIWVSAKRGLTIPGINKAAHIAIFSSACFDDVLFSRFLVYEYQPNSVPLADTGILNDEQVEQAVAFVANPYKPTDIFEELARSVNLDSLMRSRLRSGDPEPGGRFGFLEPS